MRDSDIRVASCASAAEETEAYRVAQAVARLMTPILVYQNRWMERWRKMLFLYTVVSNHGVLVMPPSVRFDHHTMFQGAGKLILSDRVHLGYPQAGALADPILLQPRERHAVINIGAGTILVNGSEIVARQSVIIGNRLCEKLLDGKEVTTQ